MIQFILPGDPITKLRPRFTKQGRAYDKQKQEKQLTKCLLMRQMADNGILRRLDGPISMEMYFDTPIPNSWSQKRKDGVLGNPDPTKPDIDNFAKFPLDVMNKLIFEDDSLITELYCVKRYSNTPKTTIRLKEHKAGKMIKEHATTVKGEITMEHLEYMVKKSNRLGLKNREIFRVFMEEDSDGKHIYFECEGMKHGQEEAPKSLGRLEPSREGLL